jgi:hypothetical protein
VKISTHELASLRALEGSNRPGQSNFDGAVRRFDDLDRASVAGDDTIGDRQAETRCTRSDVTRRVAAGERFESSFTNLRREPRPGIEHRIARAGTLRDYS